MSKTLNLNHTVRVKLTEYGLETYLATCPWKNRQEIIDNDMFIDEQLWTIISKLNKFSNGFPNKNPFYELIINDSILEDVLQPNEDKLVEMMCHKMMCHEMVDRWLGKHYTQNTKRILGYVKERPDFITVCVDSMIMLEYRPTEPIPGDVYPRYNVAQVFGHDKKNHEKKYTLGQIKKMMASYIDDKNRKEAKTEA